jgi:hypothetical protein
MASVCNSLHQRNRDGKRFEMTQNLMYKQTSVIQYYKVGIRPREVGGDDPTLGTRAESGTNGSRFPTRWMTISPNGNNDGFCCRADAIRRCNKINTVAILE